MNFGRTHNHFSALSIVCSSFWQVLCNFVFSFASYFCLLCFYNSFCFFLMLNCLLIWLPEILNISSFVALTFSSSINYLNKSCLDVGRGLLSAVHNRSGVTDARFNCLLIKIIHQHSSSCCTQRSSSQNIVAV